MDLAPDSGDGGDGMCMACGDQPSVGMCDTSDDEYCQVCFEAHHRCGNRSRHRLIHKEQCQMEPSYATNPQTPSTTIEELSMESDIETNNPVQIAPNFAWTPNDGHADDLVERCKFIPLRLNESERKSLILLESALNVSEYTDKVDIPNGNDTLRAHEIKRLCSILLGFSIINDYQFGQRIVKSRPFFENADVLMQLFEIGRRYKINNPEKMRSDYGKLMYFLQDASSMRESLKLTCISPIKTVYNFLNDRNQLKLLHDPLLPLATSPIDHHDRFHFIHALALKTQAQNELMEKYASPTLSRDDVKYCLLSISDNHSYLKCNCDCCDKMILYLKHYFDHQNDHPSLSIAFGVNGSRLSHSHPVQFAYVLQSLTLWKQILHDMFKLWSLAEMDLLDPISPYRLSNTGQGYNRIQYPPRIAKEIKKILHKVRKNLGPWMGSSIIHLGDHTVPNAFFFLTKYLSVVPILNPIIKCIERIDDLDKDHHLHLYLRRFGGAEPLKIAILQDFFKHAFDGSGSNNAFDSGPCIDGRLTSAWNWCSKIEKKSYFPIFLLTGFIGFDG